MIKTQDQKQRYIKEMLRKVDVEFDSCEICRHTVSRMSDIYEELRGSIPDGINNATVEYGELICKLMIEQRRFYYLCGIRDSRLGLRGTVKDMLDKL